MGAFLDKPWICEACTEKGRHLSEKQEGQGPKAQPLVLDEGKDEYGQGQVADHVGDEVEVEGQA